jgi:prepilin-type N-terminal cleavage/methylation domain-containing protein
MKLRQRIRRNSAFTLVELMIVVVIVAILALVAIPLYQSNVTAAKFSEGIAGVGTIRTAMRVYAASHSNAYPVLTAVDGDSLSSLNIASGSLDGKYFSGTDYEVTSTASTYTIKATLGSETYIVNQDGVESGTFTTE